MRHMAIPLSSYGSLTTTPSQADTQERRTLKGGRRISTSGFQWLLPLHGAQGNSGAVGDDGLGAWIGLAL